MRLCALDTIHHGAFNKLETKMPNALHCMLPSRLQDAPKYTLSTLPSTPPSTFSIPGMHSRTLPIALDGTLPACLTVRSQVSSQDAPKYTPSTLSSTLPSLLSRMLLIALDGTLLACLVVRS